MEHRLGGGIKNRPKIKIDRYFFLLKLRRKKNQIKIARVGVN